MQRPKLFASLLVGIVTALGLSYIRGGISDAPWVLLVFGGAGFLGSLFLLWVFHRDTMQSLERGFGRLPRSRLLRHLVAVGLVISLVYWPGPVIVSGGFSGWLIALLLVIAVPLVVCVVEPRFPILCGVLSVSCICASLLFTNARFHISHGDGGFWSDFWRRDFQDYLLMWSVFVILSLIISVPIYVVRRRA